MARKKRNSWGGVREGAGRPTENRRAVNLNVRTTPEQLERWKAAAENAGTTLTAWVEQHLDKAAR